MHIRPARPSDGKFIHGLVPRLVEFGPVPGRDRDSMIARDRTVMREALEAGSADDVVFVAEDEHSNALGFVHLTTAPDYYSDTTTAHIADIVVASHAGGRGVGTALIEFSEGWARERGYAMLTLSVIPENQRARALYHRLGFREDWIRCVKRL